jgi:hypothetical protein
MGALRPCPRCKKLSEKLSVKVGHFVKAGLETTYKVPVGQMMCDPCHEAEGIPMEVLLSPLPPEIAALPHTIE